MRIIDDISNDPLRPTPRRAVAETGDDGRALDAWQRRGLDAEDLAELHDAIHAAVRRAMTQARRGDWRARPAGRTARARTLAASVVTKSKKEHTT